MPSNICNLSSINLTKFFDKQNNVFQYDKFKDAVSTTVRFLDNILDISSIPLPQYKELIIDKRRIGIGPLGQGSLLYMMKIRFGSQYAIDFINQLFRIKAQTQLLQSAKIGKQKGSFRKFDKDQYFNTMYWKTLQIDQNVKREIQQIGCMRNSVHSTSAPNGNTSIFAGNISGGIQPVFNKQYTRWVIVNFNEKQQLLDIGYNIPDPHRQQMYQTQIFKFIKQGNDILLHGTINNIEYKIDKNRGLTRGVKVEDYGWKFVKDNYEDAYDNDYIVESQQLSVEQHVNMLAASAKYINQNQSKTVNLPANYSFEDFKGVYYNAWKRNIKGITTYRDGTMAMVLQKKKQQQEYKTQLQKLFVQANGNVIKDYVKLPKQFDSKTYVVKDVNQKKWYITLGFADRACKKPFGMFIRTNAHVATDVANTTIQAIEKLLRQKGIAQQLIIQQQQKYKGNNNVDKVARAIGMAMRHNVKMIDVVSVLEQYNDGLSTLLFHIRKLLTNFIPDGTIVNKNNIKVICQQCEQQTIVYQQGCKMCSNCGWTACG